MRIAVVGAGGVGGYFGGRLAMAGHEVHFIARGEHLHVMRRDGLRVDSPGGDFVVRPALATDDPASVGRVEAVIVAVKTWQLPDAVPSIRLLLGADTAVLPLLNGVEATDQLGAALGQGHVLGGLCRILSEIAGPGHIRHGGMEPSVILGEPDGRVSERVSWLRSAFDDAGVRVDVADDIHVALWEKFMLIATWSGIGAVTRVPVGVWRSLPGTRSMARACLHEIRDLARALGVALGDETPEATLAFIDGVHDAGTASMQRDIVMGRPSELESQNGAVVRLGAAAGVPTPTHAFLYHSLLPQERAARKGSAR